jgi:cytochrome P450 family 9
LSCVDTTEWDDDDITAQAVLFFLAGFDTASTLLCFASHQLAIHPDIQSRLQDEIDQTMEEDGGNLTYEALHGMKYLDMVVSGILEKMSYTTLPDHDQSFGLEIVIYHKITTVL